jgi:arylsulfotransferase ASST
VLTVVLTAQLGLTSATATAAAAAVNAPTCTPATLNASAVQAGAVTVSPLSGSRDASAQTQISFLGVRARDLSHIEVSGSRTGRHAGRLAAYSQGNGASFLPARPFAESERVTVRAQVRTVGPSRSLLDVFAVAKQDPITATPESIHAGASSESQGFVSRPDLRPPTVSVTAQSPAVAPGDEFLAPYSGPGQGGPMILDPSGGLVWFKPLPANTSATNLQVQQYAGRPVLTWWQGDISVHGFGLGEDVIADVTYTDIARVRAGNGLRADLHEFQLTPQRTALITVYDPIRCNLSSVGGPADGAVIDGFVQAVDVKTGLVLFQWSSLDHVGLGESYELARKSSTASPFDFFHINSINVDRDGSMLVSARNTWTTYDLDAHSGQVSWRLGGKGSSFKMGPGSASAWQHDPRELPGGEVSIFDNGSSPTVHSQSRGIVLKLDTQNRTATLVNQIIHTPALLAQSQGNMQTLGNGDWFLGWGQVPGFSEFSPGGALLFDAHFPPRTQSYRAFRFAWTGRPAHAPALAYRALAGGGGTAYASWNGSTLGAAWRVLSGPSPAELAPIAQVPRVSFETPIAVPAGAGPYLAVQALDQAGAVLGTSSAARLVGAAP